MIIEDIRSLGIITWTITFFLEFYLILLQNKRLKVAVKKVFKVSGEVFVIRRGNSIVTILLVFIVHDTTIRTIS